MGNRVPELPILGEPLIAEFANTLYVDATTRLDVLDRPAWVAAWLEQAPCASALPRTGRLGSHDVARLRTLRDAVRGLLEHGGARADDLDVITSAARCGPGERRLAWNAAGELVVVTDTGGRGIDGLVAEIARCVVDAVEDGTFELHQVCSRPGCHLYYFRDHHRRRYCNVRCANADRQARYNARRSGSSQRHTVGGG